VKVFIVSRLDTTPECVQTERHRRMGGFACGNAIIIQDKVKDVVIHAEMLTLPVTLNFLTFRKSYPINNNFIYSVGLTQFRLDFNLFVGVSVEYYAKH